MRTADLPSTDGPNDTAAPPLTWNGGGSRHTPSRTLSRNTPGASGTIVPSPSTYAPACESLPLRSPPHMPSCVLDAVGSTIASAPSQRSAVLSERHSMYGFGLPGPIAGAWHGSTALDPADANDRQTSLTPSLPMKAFSTF